MARQTHALSPINANAKTETMPTWPVGNLVAGTIQLSYNLTRTEAVWTLQQSADANQWENWKAFTVTMTTAGMTRLLDFTGINFVRLNLTTVESTTTGLKGSFILTGDTE